MATDAILLRRDAESLDAGMTGTARPGLFHLRHGVVPGLFYVEDGIVTNSAIVAILFQVDVVTEYHRIGVSEFERDVFRFPGKCGSCG